MNQTALACGVEAVKDKVYFEEGVRKIVETREWAKEELLKLGFVFPDAKANFIFARHPKVDANELFQALKENNIYVRHWNEAVGMPSLYSAAVISLSDCKSRFLSDNESVVPQSPLY